MRILPVGLLTNPVVACLDNFHRNLFCIYSTQPDKQSNIHHHHHHHHHHRLSVCLELCRIF